jgi:hypothetical protein
MHRQLNTSYITPNTSTGINVVEISDCSLCAAALKCMLDTFHMRAYFQESTRDIDITPADHMSSALSKIIYGLVAFYCILAPQSYELTSIQSLTGLVYFCYRLRPPYILHAQLSRQCTDVALENLHTVARSSKADRGWYRDIMHSVTSSCGVASVPSRPTRWSNRQLDKYWNPT